MFEEVSKLYLYYRSQQLKAQIIGYHRGKSLVSPLDFCCDVERITKHRLLFDEWEQVKSTSPDDLPIGLKLKLGRCWLAFGLDPHGDYATLYWHTRQAEVRAAKVEKSVRAEQEREELDALFDTDQTFDLHHEQIITIDESEDRVA